jgi:hypothetical protein
LRGQFGVSGLKQADERTVAERTANGLHFRKLIAAPEDVDELRTVFLGGSVRPELIEDDAPGDDRK